MSFYNWPMKMKRLNGLFNLMCWFGAVSSSNTFLSKFHQNSYKVKNVRVELIDYDKEYLNLAEIKTFKYNRSTTAHNMSINFKVNIGPSLETTTQIYKFLSNEYRSFPVRYQVNFCEAVNANIMGLKEYHCGNYIPCNYKKNVTYYTCNFVIDETHLPPKFPNGVYMAEIQLVHLQHKLLTMHYYGEVFEPSKYP